MRVDLAIVVVNDRTVVVVVHRYYFGLGIALLGFKKHFLLLKHYAV